MPWAVKLDKDEQFIGKWALAHFADAGAETALVGFTVADGHLQTEGAVVLDQRGDAVNSHVHRPERSVVVVPCRTDMLGDLVGLPEQIA